LTSRADNSTVACQIESGPTEVSPLLVDLA